MESTIVNLHLLTFAESMESVEIQKSLAKLQMEIQKKKEEILKCHAEQGE